jgi:hypothetical protein
MHALHHKVGLLASTQFAAVLAGGRPVSARSQSAAPRHAEWVRGMGFGRKKEARSV